MSVTNWDEFGLLLSLADVAKLYNRSPRGIRRMYERGDLPAPDAVRPMQWSRERLRAHLEPVSPFTQKHKRSA